MQKVQPIELEVTCFHTLEAMDIRGISHFQFFVYTPPSLYPGKNMSILPCRMKRTLDNTCKFESVSRSLDSGCKITIKGMLVNRLSNFLGWFVSHMEVDTITW